MKSTKTKIATLAMLGLLAACGDGSKNGSNDSEQKATSEGTLPAMETDSDPTPQTGTGGSGQSRQEGGVEK